MTDKLWLKPTSEQAGYWLFAWRNSGEIWMVWRNAGGICERKTLFWIKKTDQAGFKGT